MPIRERYHNDPEFAALVDGMVSHIELCRYTPSEMREAAILASIIYEERHVKQQLLIEVEVEEALRIIEQKLNSK